ncbi:hypothetical protein [Vibrio sonorensis]|uniref:hypothetical protein n=1 Tax=Vibrio sonorensis TaxID=1004316 RepID=UPI0008D92E4B|nr:hypothetical protein [Vibrio sonorensis]
MTNSTLSIPNFGLMSVIALMVIVAVAVANPVHAADLFTNAKTDIKDTAGTGSAVEMALLAFGGIGAIAFGFMSKNWIGAITGFAVGVLFWNIITPMIGL